jgi:hypothetical protein
MCAFDGLLAITGQLTPNPGGGRSAWIAYELAMLRYLCCQPSATNSQRTHSIARHYCGGGGIVL